MAKCRRKCLNSYFLRHFHYNIFFGTWNTKHVLWPLLYIVFKTVKKESALSLMTLTRIYLILEYITSCTSCITSCITSWRMHASLMKKAQYQETYKIFKVMKTWQGSLVGSRPLIELHPSIHLQSTTFYCCNFWNNIAIFKSILIWYVLIKCDIVFSFLLSFCPSSNRLGFDQQLGRGGLVNQIITAMFKEQPLAFPDLLINLTG